MNTQISSKFAALAVAMMMNTLLIVGVAYLFNSQSHLQTTVLSLVQAASPASQVGV